MTGIVERYGFAKDDQILFFLHIKVELPVAGQPPCRSLRAVFPHRAPQLGCAVALALCWEQAWGLGL